MAGDQVVGHLGHPGGAGDVHHHALDRAALGLQRALRGLDIARVQVGDDDAGAGFGQRVRGGQADAAGAAGDEGDAVGQLELFEVHAG